MGRLIVVAGISGVGKTALTRRLCELLPLVTGLEQHEERPFQALFAREHSRFSLANQFDYLLFRAEQELAIRESQKDGIIDGGLELDYFLFSHLFYQKGYLSTEEFRLCQRLYRILRQALPAPDLILYLRAPLSLVARRFAARGRSLEIAELADMEDMERLLEQWMQAVQDTPVIQVDASQDDPLYTRVGEELSRRIQAVLKNSPGAQDQDG
ncbi:MAG: deoxynucleoside kinase [Anaerolineales bacterium]|nr:deoxynucleoside kinase [Anaerolineales bacterium]